MPRRKAAEKRKKTPDYKFKDVLAGQFVNYLMRRGKKSLAEQIFYDAMDILTKKTGQPGVNVFKKAMEKIGPSITSDMEVWYQSVAQQFRKPVKSATPIA